MNFICQNLFSLLLHCQKCFFSNASESCFCECGTSSINFKLSPAVGRIVDGANVSIIHLPACQFGDILLDVVRKSSDRGEMLAVPCVYYAVFQDNA